jgi:hypothetical protein
LLSIIQSILEDDSAPLHPATPQGQAFQWLAFEDQTPLSNHVLIVQRFVMAVIYFAMNLDKVNFQPQIEWLSIGTSECDWYRLDCTDDGLLSSIDLVKIKRDQLRLFI